MKLIKGLVTDLNDIDSPEGAWKYARNAMYVQQGALSNELGFFNPINPPAGKMLIGNIPLPDDRFIMFYVNVDPIGITDVYLGSSIYVLSVDNILSPVVLEDDLNFNPNYPINGKFKFNNRKELLISFTDFFNPPRLINLKFLTTLVILSSDKDYNLFLNLKVSKISDMQVRNGGNLLSGSYQFAFRYKFKDNSVTGVYFISNHIPIYVSNSSNYDRVEGDEAGKLTSKSIKLDIIDIDTDYEKLMVYVIKTVGQITTAHLIGEYFISSPSLSFVYTGSQETSVALSEILTSFSSYTKVKTLEVHQDWLYGGNVSVAEIEMNYQSIANSIVVKWNAEEAVSLNQVSGSYKDPSTVFIKRGFMPGEVVALYIRFVLLNGQRSIAYHIPGRAPLAGETDSVSLTYLQKIDASAKNFHLLNTAQVDSGDAKGLMGYWENETERYPNVNSWGSRKNNPVRHHKFPDLQFLSEELGSIISLPTFASFSKSGNFPENGFDNNPSSVFVCSLSGGATPFLSSFLTLSGISASGTRSYDSVSYIIPDTKAYTFELTLIGEVIALDELAIPISYLRFIVYRGTDVNPQIETLALRNTVFSSPPNTPYVVNEVYTIEGLELNAGDRITFVPIIDLETLGRSYFTSVTATLDLNLAEGEEIDLTSGMRILGLELSNINIPDELRGKVQGYEILYAQRGLENSQILGQGLLTTQNWYAGVVDSIYNKSGRFYSFDMLNLKPATGATHVKFHFTYGLTDDSDILVVDEEYNAISLFQAELQKVEGIEYVPNDNTAVTPTNEKREEYINITFVDNLPTIFNPRNFICELHSLKKDVYLSFDRQVLVSTGIIHPISLFSSVQQTGLLFGGDTFVSPYGINMHFKNTSTFEYRTIRAWSFSTGNIGLRTSEREWNKKYYPIADVLRNRWNLISNEEIPADVDLGIPADVQEAKENLVMKSTDLYSYNLDYSRLNSLVQGVVFLDDIPLSRYPFRVIRSLPSQRESDIETWRNFPAFDYYEMPKEKGEIWNLASLGSILLIHQEYMLYKTRGNGVLKMQSNDEIQLGEGDVFEFRPDEVIPVGLSYAGTKSMYACLVCKLGYVFLDQSQGRVFIYNSELMEISNKSMLNFFNDNFKKVTIDNPYMGRGFSVAYDNRYNRLLFSYSGAGESIVISYSNYIDSWVSHHSFKAGVMFNSPNKLMSIEHFDYTDNNGVYQHNNPAKRGVYYDAQPEPFIIDVAMPLDYRLSKKTLSVTWIADRIKNDSLLRDKSFDKIFLHNSFQATRFEILDYYDFVSGNVRNIKNSWNFDLIRNIGLGNEPIINGEVNLLNLDDAKPWYEREEFEDKYIVMRLVLNNDIESGVQDIIFLYDVSANNILKIR